MKTVREGHNELPPQNVSGSRIAGLFAHLLTNMIEGPQVPASASKAVGPAFFIPSVGGNAAQMELFIQHRFGDGRSGDTFPGMDQSAITG